MYNLLTEFDYQTVRRKILQNRQDETLLGTMTTPLTFFHPDGSTIYRTVILAQAKTRSLNLPGAIYFKKHAEVNLLRQPCEHPHKVCAGVCYTPHAYVHVHTRPQAHSFGPS